MKGGIVAMLYAILAIKGCGEELNGKVGLTLVPDEETGGRRGSALLASAGGNAFTCSNTSIALMFETLPRVAHLGKGG